MPEKIYNVLFICSANSARSIMAEAILNRIGQGRFRAFSAGSEPAGAVHPLAMDLLKRLDFDTRQLRSKYWSEFSGEGALPLDFVFTVCDKAAGEPCPIWPGQPIRAHWGVEDPALLYATEARQKKLFFDVYCLLKRRIELFCELPIAKPDSLMLIRQLDQIVHATAEMTSTADAQDCSLKP